VLRKFWFIQTLAKSIRDISCEILFGKLYCELWSLGMLHLVNAQFTSFRDLNGTHVTNKYLRTKISSLKD